MYSNKLKYLVLSVLILVVASLKAQDPGDVTSLLQEEVENWNPVYKPVIGLGFGSFNYYGDIRTANQNLFSGDPGFKVNVATFIDNRHYFRGNFYLIGGLLSGNERSSSDTLRNLNFQSNIFVFGVNVNYDFDHFIHPQRRIRPFVSIGAELITFDSKTDISRPTSDSDAQPVYYRYWTDGSIRDDYQSLNPNANLIRRDHVYESDIKEIDPSLESYPQYSLAIPLDFGLDYQITDRVMFRIASSLHYTFSDEIDHVNTKNTNGIVGNAQKDFFTFSYFTIHLDLFSSDKTLTWEKLFAEVEFDNTLMGDEDGDGWFDGIDQCPGTPFGVETDTVGCPVDNDLDGYPDYQDDEPNSRYGAYVDERGVEMTEDDVIASLDMSKAVDRGDISKYIRTPSSYSNYRSLTAKEIPEKYKHVDEDEDGYLSFDEMMNAIDSFFDFDTELESEDIYKLNDFFFSQ